jgi:hypothetical protein
MAVVRAHFDRRGKVGNAKAKDNVRYIQHRPNKDKEAVMRPLFTSDGPLTRLEAYQFIDEAPKGTHFYTIIINPDPEKEDTHKDLDMRQITITTMQSIEECVQTPVVWVAAVHDDHTDKNHVHALAAVPRRLDTPELNRIREATTQACLEQRQELDRTRGQKEQERVGVEWELEPTLEEDAWEE